MSEQRIAIVGAAESDYGKCPGRSEFDLHNQAAERALSEAGLGKDDVDGLFSLTNGYFRCPSLLVAEYLGIHPTYEDCTSVGGSSFELLVEHAMAALQAGRCKVALITYGSDQLSVLGRTLGTKSDPISHIAQQYEEPYGLNIVSAYALAARRHMHEYGTTSEQLAEIAVSTRKNASLNPLAMYRDPLTVEDVVNSRMIASPLHKFDCCVISDGGGALVLTTEDRARDCAKDPVWVLGSSQCSDHLHIADMPDLTESAAAVTGPRAMAEAGVKPEDIDLLCTYDSFTITVLRAIEDLGFCEKGEGGAFVEGGRTAVGGDFPVNPDGGGLSSNHPGMRGIFLLIESVRQLRGEGGDRQVADAELAVAHGVGGWLSSHGTVVLGKDK
jgi:acetyl-CoA acetyltransferase